MGACDSAEIYAVRCVKIDGARREFMTSEEVLLKTFKGLSGFERKELLDFAEFLESRKNAKRPRHSLKGALAHLNIRINDEDIREARNEMWRGYTKDTESEK